MRSSRTCGSCRRAGECCGRPVSASTHPGSRQQLAGVHRVWAGGVTLVPAFAASNLPLARPASRPPIRSTGPSSTEAPARCSVEFRSEIVPDHTNEKSPQPGRAFGPRSVKAGCPRLPRVRMHGGQTRQSGHDPPGIGGLLLETRSRMLYISLPMYAQPSRSRHHALSGPSSCALRPPRARHPSALRTRTPRLGRTA
jgi:hypothetical protein